jgi:endonuclease/exonuclease/phosphatase family metal-dependent hydrolase
MEQLACSARVMTYNVHGFVGTDGVYDPERVARVIEASGVDIVALQEVDAGRATENPARGFEWLSQRLAMKCCFSLTREGQRGRFGNAVLTRHPYRLMAEGLLPRARDEARGVQWLRVSGPNWELHLMNTHLSINLRERSAQVQALLGAEWLARAGTELPLIVCGDFNSSPFSAVYRRLAGHLHDVQRGSERKRMATWPSRLPFWRIDHVFVSREINVASCSVPRDALTRSASDHLPVVADLVLRPAAPGEPLEWR